MLLDGSLGKLEVRIYAGILAVAGPAGLYILKLGFDRFIRNWDAEKKERDDTRKRDEKIKHADHVRLWQHDEYLVREHRKGEEFPDHSG